MQDEYIKSLWSESEDSQRIARNGSINYAGKATTGTNGATA